MGSADALQGAHSAQRIGERQANLMNDAFGAQAAQCGPYRRFAEKTVGMWPVVDSLPRLIELRQRSGQQRGKRHPPAGSHHPAQLAGIQHLGKIAARQLAQQQIGAAPLQFIMLRIAAGRPAKRRGHRLLIHRDHAAPPVNG